MKKENLLQVLELLKLDRKTKFFGSAKMTDFGFSDGSYRFCSECGGNYKRCLVPKHTPYCSNHCQDKIELKCRKRSNSLNTPPTLPLFSSSSSK